MRLLSPCLLLALLLVGCATRPTVANNTLDRVSPPLVATASATKLVETRYEVRGYREAADSSLRHEAHAVYRRTRVALDAGVELGTAPRESFPPASVAPLPESAELAAELATQRKVTAEVRAMQVTLAEAEQKMTAQYAILVRQTAETMKLREQIVAERVRLQTPATAQPGPPAPVPVLPVSTDVKW